ncbi:MAG: hypothetical protein BWY02_00360 [bacterium ADurb.Bin157]|jgi:hypothetical protein|nr:MAG: hypothetical protein BWY02_00360 [bacterium ADurb.Bin157]
MEKIQIISIIGSVLFLFFIVELIKRCLIKEAYSILWLFFGGLFLFISLWKDGVDWFAKIVGIYYPPAMLLLFLIIAVIFVLIQFSVVVSKQSDQIRKLAQEVALLKSQQTKENDH